MATGKTWDEMLKDLESQLNSGSSSSSSSSLSTSVPTSTAVETNTIPITLFPHPTTTSTKLPPPHDLPSTVNDTLTNTPNETVLVSPSKKSDKKKRSKDKNTKSLSLSTEDNISSSTGSNQNNGFLSGEIVERKVTADTVVNAVSTPKPNSSTAFSDPMSIKTPELVLTNDKYIGNPSISLPPLPPPSTSTTMMTSSVTEIPTPSVSLPSSSLYPLPTSPSQQQQQPVLLTGAVAHALADAVAKAVNRVDKWQKKSEAQGKVITRLRQEMIKAGITLPPLSNSSNEDDTSSLELNSADNKSTDDSLLTESEQPQLTTVLNNNNNLSSPSLLSGSASTTMIAPTPAPYSATKTSESIPSTVTLKLGPNAVNLLKQSGFGSTNNVPNKTDTVSSPSKSPRSCKNNGIVANSYVDSAPIPSSFPFTSSLVTAVALAHAGHPDRLCAETAACGTLARQLRIEVQLLRSVIEQLRTEHQRRMKAQTTIIDQLRDRVQELENNKVPGSRLSKSPKNTVSSHTHRIIPSQLSPIPSSSSVSMHTPNNPETTNDENGFNEQALWETILINQQENNMDNDGEEEVEENENHHHQAGYHPRDDEEHHDEKIDEGQQQRTYSTSRSSDPLTNYYSRRDDDRMELNDLSNPTVSASTIRGRTKASSVNSTKNHHTNNQYSSVYKQDPTAHTSRARSASNRRPRATNDPKTPIRNRPVSAGPLGRTMGRTSTIFGSSANPTTRLSNPVPPRTPGGGLSFTAGLHPPQATSPPTVLRRGTGLGAGGALLRVKNTNQQGMSDELKAAILGKPNILPTNPPNGSSSSSNNNNGGGLRKRSQSRGTSTRGRNTSRASLGGGNPNSHSRYPGGTFAKAGTSPAAVVQPHKHHPSAHFTEKKSPVLDAAAAAAAAAARIKDYKRTHTQVLPVIKLLHPPSSSNPNTTVPSGHPKSSRTTTVSPPRLPTTLSQYTGNQKLPDTQIEFVDSLGVTAISKKRALHIDIGNSSTTAGGGLNPPSLRDSENNGDHPYNIPSSLLAVLDNLTRSK